MKKTKKRLSRSTLLLVLCTVLVGLLLAIVLLQRITAPDDQAPPTSGSNDPIVLAEASPADITAITIRHGTSTFRLLRGSTEWVLEENTAYPLDADAVDRFVNGCAKITASKKVLELSETSVLSLYGLHDPYKVSVVVGQRSYTIELGSKYSTGNSYYFRMQGENTLYRMDNAQAVTLRTSLSTLTFGAKLPAIYSDTLHTIALTSAPQGGSTTTVTYTKETDPDLLTQALLAVSAIDTKQYADVAPTETKLAEYGLSTETAQLLTLKTTRFVDIGTGAVKHEDFVYRIGNTVTVTTGDSARQLAYVMIPDQPYVYYLDAAVLNLLQTP